MKSLLIKTLRSRELSYIDLKRALPTVKEILGNEGSVECFERGTVKGIRAKISMKLVFEFRVTESLSELYVRLDSLGINSLSALGFNELANILKEHSLSPSQLIISCSRSSRTVHLIICGDSKITPNIRVMVRVNDFDVMSSYCRLSKSEDTCKLLRRLLNYVKTLLKEVSESN